MTAFKILNIQDRPILTWPKAIGYSLLDVIGGLFIAVIISIIFKNKKSKTQKSIPNRHYPLYDKSWKEEEDDEDDNYGINNFEQMYQNKINPNIFFLTSILQAFFAGVTEELTFRFLLMKIILLDYFKCKPIVAIIVSAIIFGGTHFINISTGQSIKDTSAQALNAFLGGVFDGFIYYQTGVLVIPMISHFIYDAIIMISIAVEYKKFYNKKKKIENIDKNIKKNIKIFFKKNKPFFSSRILKIMK